MSKTMAIQNKRLSCKRAVLPRAERASEVDYNA
jgi:hypothetical protein